MSDFNILPQSVRNQLIKIKEEILSGKISLLELELNPIFQEIIDSVSTSNIFQYSPLYKETNDILYRKFEDLKKLLIRMDSKRRYMHFLKKSPTDAEIAALYDGCWLKTFHVESLSFDYLKESQQKLLAAHNEPISIKELSKVKSKEKFILEIPKKKFTEKMNQYFRSIMDKLPCHLDEIFEKETDQLESYEHFIYLLHLLQLGRIKYQKETNTIYK
jgi:hypothetical protein